MGLGFDLPPPIPLKMFRTHLFRFLRTAIALVVASVVISGQSAFGATGNTQLVSTSISIVGQQLRSIDVDPGQQLEGDIRLRNSGSTPVSVSTSVNDFVSGSDSGDPDIVPSNKGRNAESFAKWTVLTPETATLAPTSDSLFHYKISIPKNASPGGHYGAIGFRQASNDQKQSQTAVAIRAYIYSLFLLNVSGSIHYGAEIEKISIKKIPATAFSRSYNEIEVTIRNTGNTHFRPSVDATIDHNKGEIKFKRWPFGGGGFYPLDSTLIGKNDAGFILPNTSRTFHSRISDGALYGFYRVNVKALYGPPDGSLQAVESSRIIWLSPGVSLLVFWGIFPLLLLIILVQIRMGHKRGSRRRNAPRGKFAKP
jgi:hypothetical protein